MTIDSKADAEGIAPKFGCKT